MGLSPNAANRPKHDNLIVIAFSLQNCNALLSALASLPSPSVREAGLASDQRTQFLPEALARYIALSARRMASTIELSPWETAPTPMQAVTEIVF